MLSSAKNQQTRTATAALHNNSHIWISLVGVVIMCLLHISTAKHPHNRMQEGKIYSHPQEHATCNKELCASIVSYCLIQDLCSCHPTKNCSCCAECALCLGDYYRHCCDCVGMRKSVNYTAGLSLTTSTVALLDDPSPELFESLTERVMPKLKYTILRFPITQELAVHDKMENSKFQMQDGIRRNGNEPGESQVYQVLERSYNLAVCTATYFDQCFSLMECKASCDSMGATSFRWFHTGCCECVGHTCLNYGNPYPKCKECMK